MLSNQKIINEIKASQRDYVNSRPEMIFKPFVSNKSERDYNLGDRGKRRDVIGGYKSLGQHPRFSYSINGNTLHPDPLLGGGIQGKTYNNFSEFNHRGGAVLSEKMPLTGGYHSDSDFHSETDDENSSSYCESDKSESDKSESDYEENDIKGGGVYDDYIKPAGKALYNVGQEVFKDVVVPVGKEILKNAIIGLMTGAGKKGGLSGTKKEFIHILKSMYPDIDFSKKSKKELMEEIKKSIPETDFIQKMKSSEPRKRGRPKSDKPPKEAKKRGRPKSTVEKPPKEAKKRGRPKVEKLPKEAKTKLDELDDMFKNILEKKEDIIEPVKKNIKVKINKKKGGKIEKIVGTKRGEKVRGDVVAEVMKKHGLNLGQASKYVSEHNLY